MAKVALLIGVSEYEPGLNSLPGAVMDVDAMQQVLQHPDVGEFAPGDITVLKNPNGRQWKKRLKRYSSIAKRMTWCWCIFPVMVLKMIAAGFT
jgi:hypothetical protein